MEDSKQNQDTTAATQQQQEESKVEQQPGTEQPAGEATKDQKKVNTKHEKEKKKAERLAARQKKTVEEEYKKDPNDPSAHLFGELELNRSQSDPEQRYARKFTAVKDLEEAHNGQEVLVRGRLHASRATGKMCFVVIREQFATVQAVLAVSESISKGMVTFAAKIPKESIVDVKAIVTIPEKPVHTCSQKVELQITEVWVVNKSVPMLPFQLEDASRRVENQEDEEKQVAHEESKDGKHAVVGQDVRLNNRIIDLRVPTNQALMRLQSAVG